MAAGLIRPLPDTAVRFSPVYRSKVVRPIKYTGARADVSLARGRDLNGLVGRAGRGGAGLLVVVTSMFAVACGPAEVGPSSSPDSAASETASVTEPAAEAGPPSAGPRGPDTSSLPGSVAAVALPFLAVNTVDALLPMGRARGLLSVEKDCVVFILRGQRYAPIWPIGTRLSETGEQVLGPDGQVFDLGEEATFDGASFSLKNESMRLERPIPGRCPRATYAINL